MRIETGVKIPKEFMNKWCNVFIIRLRIQTIITKNSDNMGYFEIQWFVYQNIIVIIRKSTMRIENEKEKKDIGLPIHYLPYKDLPG